jgi:hypothetical protein
VTTTEVDAAANGRTWIVPASAVAFAVLMVAGALTAEAGGKLTDKTAAQVVKSFHDGKGVAILSAFLLTLAGLAFLPLAWGATQRVRAGLSSLGEYMARTCAQLFVAMVLIAGAAGGTLAFVVVFEPEKDPPADLIRFVPLFLDSVIRIGGALAVGVFLAVIARAGQKAGVVPPWFSALGYVAAVGMLGAVFVYPFILLPIWALAAAYVLRSPAR